MSEPFSTDDLRAWRNDPKGKPFWDAVQDRFANGVSMMRAEVRKGNLHEATKHGTQVDAAEDILQLVDGLVAEQVAEAKDREQQ